MGLLLRVYGGLLWACLLTLAQSPPPQAIAGRSTLGSLESLPWGLELWGAASYMMLACGPWTQDRLSPQGGRGRGALVAADLSPGAPCCHTASIPEATQPRTLTVGATSVLLFPGSLPDCSSFRQDSPSVSPGRSWCLKGSICVCTEDRALAQDWLGEDGSTAILKHEAAGSSASRGSEAPWRACSPGPSVHFHVGGRTPRWLCPSQEPAGLRLGPPPASV